MVALGDEASHYVARVHRCAVGQTVLLFDAAQGTEAAAEIVTVQGKRVTCRVHEVTVGTRRGVVGLHLVQGLGKGDKPDQIVRDGVVLGVQSIRFVVCERSVAQATDRDAVKLERLTRIATEAARQCGRSNLPRLELGVRFDAALPGLRREVDSDGEKRRRDGGGTDAEKRRGDGPAADGQQGRGDGPGELALVLHPDEDSAPVEAVVTRAVERDPALRIAIWVGPEGGFSERELELLSHHGAARASLGELVLRTELAAIVATARVGACLARLR